MREIVLETINTFLQLRWWGTQNLTQNETTMRSNSEINLVPSLLRNWVFKSMTHAWHQFANSSLIIPTEFHCAPWNETEGITLWHYQTINSSTNYLLRDPWWTKSITIATSHKTPKKGLLMAEFSSEPAVFSNIASTLSLGITKNSPSSLWNPQSCRNSTPPFKLPTLSWNKPSQNQNVAELVTEKIYRKYELVSYIRPDRRNIPDVNKDGYTRYLESSICQPNLPIFFLVRILRYIADVGQHGLKRLLNLSIVLLQKKHVYWTEPARTTMLHWGECRNENRNMKGSLKRTAENVLISRRQEKSTHTSQNWEIF